MERGVHGHRCGGAREDLGEPPALVRRRALDLARAGLARAAAHEQARVFLAEERLAYSLTRRPRSVLEEGDGRSSRSALAGRQLIERARSGTISETELAGGTFSVSNLGAYGISQFSAIILPPQVAILAVGSVIEKLVPGKGMPMSARMMKVTLSADHRVLDGVAAAQFLRELKLVLENPVRLLA